MIKNRVLQLSLTSGYTSETAIDSLTVPDGHVYKVIESRVPSTALITSYVYVVNERVLELPGSVNADQSPLVLNWELPAGTQVKVTGKNNTGSTALVGVNLIYDDITK
jgi:hypothetical protein